MNELHLPSLAPLAAAWAARGWLALLAFTAAVLVVAALRRPCRRWFGAERAFQLWLLPPLALLASQLPHAAALAPLPPLVYTITSAAGTVAPQAGVASGFDWRVGAMLLWLAGGVAVFVLAALAQLAYRRRLHGATPMADARSRRPVLRATRIDVGPALVGAWRSRIVLPVDFAERYDTIEQALILAHEDAHAQRGDGWWCLFAQLLAALFWCHPLAWWALAALRHDQELACDAAVLRGHGAQRRSYANAMLKTQSAAFALPVGCAWSPRHPLTERIAMLKSAAPNRLRRSAGMVAVCMLAVVVAGTVYAASAPANASIVGAAVSEYQLTMKLSANDGHAGQQGDWRMGLCMKPGETGSVRVGDRTIDATPIPEGDNRLRMDLVVMEGGKRVAKPRLHGALGETQHAEGKGYALDVTPMAGCPARDAKSKS